MPATTAFASATRRTVARLSCSSVRCWDGQPGDCSLDTNRLAGHEQRFDRKKRRDLREQHGDCVRLGSGEPVVDW